MQNPERVMQNPERVMREPRGEPSRVGWFGADHKMNVTAGVSPFAESRVSFAHCE